MHILRPQFRIEDDRALAFAAARGFGAIVAADARGPRASHVPFVIERRDDRVIVQIHLTAKNPLVELADGVRRFLLIVSGDDAYISNDWYVSRDNVSTWLYQVVHLSGVAQLRGLDENRGHGDALLAASEARLPKQPWDLAQMEPTKREQMLSAIRVIDLVVDEIEGQSKLNQHKSDADYVALVNRLADAEETASRRLAAKMRALRPELEYGKELVRWVAGKADGSSEAPAEHGTRISNDERPKLNLRSGDYPVRNRDDAGLPPAKPIRTQEQLEPLARQVALNDELMERFRKVVGSNDQERSLTVIDDIWTFSKSIDPTVSHSEATRMTLVLLKIVEQERASK